jgi:hypothetical protein
MLELWILVNAATTFGLHDGWEIYLPIEQLWASQELFLYVVK